MATRLTESPDQDRPRPLVAAAFFLGRLAFIPEASLEAGVGPDTLDQMAEDPIIRVFLESRDSDAWRQVRELEGETIDRYPRSGLRIRLSEKRSPPRTPDR